MNKTTAEFTVILPLVGDFADPPRVHWVLVPGRENKPSPFQVLLGQQATGDVASQFGTREAFPVQLRHWLALHNYPDVFDEIAGAMHLYLRTTPFAVQMSVRLPPGQEAA